MTDMFVSAARSRPADVIDDARVHHAPVFLTRRGRGDWSGGSGAPQPGGGGPGDVETAHAARAEAAECGTVPWDEVKAGFGLV